jgi:hypothetical protein
MTEIRADRLIMLGKSGGSQESTLADSGAAPSKRSTPDDLEDDIPF